MSDEEKKLIEKIHKGNKIGIYELIRTFKKEGIENFITIRREYIDIMINLIEKQQKEIESLKEDNKKKSIVIIEYQDLYEKLLDKIKAKIEELKKDEKREIIVLNPDTRGGCVENVSHKEEIKVLQSLLEKE